MVVYFGIFHGGHWNGLQLGFDLIILGEVSGKSAFLFML
jgi:hypothetical protein